MARDLILDLRTAERRLLECRRCFEPVASSDWSGRVTMRCGYCGFEEERELVLVSATADASPATSYRDAPPAAAAAEAAKLQVDVGALLPGHRVDALTRDRVRAAWAARARAGDGPSAEWEPIWMTVWLGHQLAVLGNPLLARVTLETALEQTQTPAYRALLLARLAQHAAAQRAVPLAEKWLAGCPPVAVAEIESEIRAAEVLIALVDGKLEEVRVATGSDRAGDGFVGNALWLAIALNLAAQEGLGRTSIADDIVGDLRQKKILPNVTIPIAACQLTRAPLIRMNRALRRKQAAISIGAVVLSAFVSLAGRDAPIDAFIVALVTAASLTYVLAFATYAWRNSAPVVAKARLRGVVFSVGLAAIVVVTLSTVNAIFR